MELIIRAVFIHDCIMDVVFLYVSKMFLNIWDIRLEFASLFCLWLRILGVISDLEVTFSPVELIEELIFNLDQSRFTFSLIFLAKLKPRSRVGRCSHAAGPRSGPGHVDPRVSLDQEGTVACPPQP